MKSSTRKIIVGLSVLLIANTIWGVMSPLCKELLNAGLMNGITLSAIRMLAGTILFWILTPFVKESRRDFGTLYKKDVLPLIVGSVIFIIGTQTLTNIGVQYTYPVDAAVCCCVTPIFTLILGAIFYYKQFPPLFKILGVILGLTGVLIFIFATEDNPEMHADNVILGDTLCVLSQVAGATYLVFYVRIASRYSAFTLMKWLYTFSTICFMPFTLGDIIAIPWQQMTGTLWFDLAYIVVLGSFVGYLLIPLAQHNVKPTVIAIANYIQPISAAIYAVILGMAVITNSNIIATILIFIGVWLVVREHGAKE